MMMQAKIKEDQRQVQDIETAYKHASAQSPRDNVKCQELVGIVPPFTA